MCASGGAAPPWKEVRGLLSSWEEAPGQTEAGDYISQLASVCHKELRMKKHELLEQLKSQSDVPE